MPGKVNYNGLAIDSVNTINKTLKTVFDDFGLNKINEIKGGSSKLAEANGQLLKLNKSKATKEEIHKYYTRGNTNYIELANKKVEYQKSLVKSEWNDKLLQESEYAAKFTRWSVHTTESNVLEELIIHESGHIIEDQLLGNLNRIYIQERFGIRNPATRLIEFSEKTKVMRTEWINTYKSLTNDEKFRISKYSVKNDHETFSESLVMFYKEPDKLPKSLFNFFTKLKEYGRK